MTPIIADSDVDVFVSYSSRDRARVMEIATRLEAEGLKVWIDRARISGGSNYGPEIVRGIKSCKVMVLMCSDSSLRSHNVKQEIQLAWKYRRPYLPLLLEPTSFPEQVEYWLEGWQWIEVMDHPEERWLKPVLEAISTVGFDQQSSAALGVEEARRPVRVAEGLEGLRQVARYTDEIWPVPLHSGPLHQAAPVMRDLGAPQTDVQHGHRLGSRLKLALEVRRTGHLLLLDEGTSGALYCLCPSWFAPETRLEVGLNHLPQQGARYDSFVVSGQPGREQLLAIVSDEPLGLDWMPRDPNVPARTLNRSDVDDLMSRVRDLEGDHWIALSTYFDIIA